MRVGPTFSPNRLRARRKHERWTDFASKSALNEELRPTFVSANIGDPPGHNRPRRSLACRLFTPA